MTTKTDVTTTRVNEDFKKAQSLPQLTSAMAVGRYAAPACQPAAARPTLGVRPETAAATPHVAAACSSTALWIGLDTARDTVKEGFVLGLLAVAATVSIVQAFGGVGELALGKWPADAWVARLAG